MKQFTIIAHRGFSAKAPENTIAAFDLAISSGFTNIELDVQLTSDGIPVVIHDSTLDRTTNGAGNVKDYDLLTLQQLDAGSWFDARFADQTIPTLDEVLTRYAAKAHLYIELKSDEPELAEKVKEILQIHDLMNHEHDNLFTVPGITITSFIFEQLQRSLAIIPLTHSWLVETINEQTVKTALDVGIGQLCPRAQNVTSVSVELAIASTLSVRGWGVKQTDDVLKLYQSRASGATVNWPDLARKALAEV